MKGFKETEIGLIPEDWEIRKLQDILYPVDKTKRRILIQENELYQTLKTKLYGKGIVLNPPVSGKKIKSKYLFKLEPGDFIYSKINIRKGACGIIREKEAKAVVSSEHPILRPRESMLYIEFLDYFLKVPTTWKIISKEAKGFSGKERVKLKEFLKLEIPLPPIEEQKAIAKVLDSVREAIEKTENVIKALKKLKKSLMEYLFTYGPVPYEERNRVELRQTEIGLIPKHWEVKEFGSLYEIQQGKAVSRKNTEGTLCPFLRTSNIAWGKILFPIESKMPFTAKEKEKLELKHGDLLICEGGEVGRTAIWKYKFQQIFFQNHIFRARVISQTNTYPQFHMYWMQYAILLKHFYVGYENKTTIPNLSRRRLSSFLIPVPPIEEQKEIAGILDKVDSRIEAEEKKKKVLEELFKTLLNKLMTGKLRVSKEFLNEFKDTAKSENS